ncbi:hypothetical protein Rhe02_61060 [Rhizocola hellebori]|uniref:Uncharacterized protein n=1 Tax=Rhizocola hellebori TaxID=1392758 RepID=A0A8J3QC37_9ACTN|nr:hypothetical protein [Rhizocola hellebori]GIH08039.1 hypothetical protein Rhe02_61060 [Rhizocola hellebori]
MDLLVYAVAVLLLGSVVLFVKVALFNRRPQKTGLLFALLSLPLYAIYYADHWPWGDLPLLRQSIEWLKNFEGADTAFKSDPAPAFLVAGILLVHMTVVQRVAAGKRLERIQDPIANFFGSTMLASLAGGIVVSTFHLGWVGALVVGVAYTLVYLGVLALLAAIVEVLVELAKLMLVWLKRWAFLVATWITRVSSFVSSLAGRLGLTSLADRIRAERGEQEQVFLTEQDRQDKELYEAFLRDRAKQRRMSGRTEQQVQDEIAELTAPEAEPAPSPAVTAALPSTPA